MDKVELEKRPKVFALKLLRLRTLRLEAARAGNSIRDLKFEI
jgi:hypothetical protein